jgi:ParB-like chromosome segregation protein Spo0J
MKNTIKSININILQPHPENPNRMSKENLRKLKRHIETSGRYEPIIIRPKSLDKRLKTSRYAQRDTQYEIINGHHRVEVLKQLGYEKCDCIVWNVDDDQARILLTTLNRLSGNDVLDKKTTLLTKLNKKFTAKELSKLLPNTAPQIERLVKLNKKKLDIKIAAQKIELPHVMTFFLTRQQKETIEQAISLAPPPVGGDTTKAKRNAEAITKIAHEYMSKCVKE